MTGDKDGHSRAGQGAR